MNALSFNPRGGLLKKDLLVGTKLVETLCPKGPLQHFDKLKTFKIKPPSPHPLHAKSRSQSLLPS